FHPEDGLRDATVTGVQTCALPISNSTEDVIAILKDTAKYPSPVRAIGSNHSTARCGAVEGGTLIKMTSMNRILNVTPETVTVQGDRKSVVEGKAEKVEVVRGTRYT